MSIFRLSKSLTFFAVDKCLLMLSVAIISEEPLSIAENLLSCSFYKTLIVKYKISMSLLFIE